MGKQVGRATHPGNEVCEMTLPEIQALKRELEVALAQAFSDFAALTGLAVENIEVASGHVTVTLERV